MQITNTIRICCANCGAEMPTEITVGREYENNLWIFRVLPCVKCYPRKYYTVPETPLDDLTISDEGGE